MPAVTVLTLDERLRREVTHLLAPLGYTVDESGRAQLYIVDEDTATLQARSSARVLTISRSGGNLRRPFTFEAFRNAVKAAFEEEESAAFSDTEARLLALLRDADGEPVSRETLIRGVWGEDGGDGLLNLYIHYLRQKLEKDGKRRIFSARGKGYFYKC